MPLGPYQSEIHTAAIQNFAPPSDLNALDTCWDMMFNRYG